MPFEDQLASNSVSISYFDPFDVFDAVKEQFIEVFPIQNIHWKTPNGAVRTIDRLPISLVSETKAAETDSENIQLFIRFIVVNCISVENYRSKVRPLIRKWLPADETDNYRADLRRSPMPIILLYANSEVVDSNLFKSVSLLDKFTKDFPGVKVMELKSVYKSPKEKEEFWGQLSQQLKSFILYVFQQRLEYYQMRLTGGYDGGKPNEEMIWRENILELYSALNMYEEATNELHEIKERLLSLKGGVLPKGTLEVPFRFSQANTTHNQASLSKLLRENGLTRFQFHKYFFTKQFELLAKRDSISLNAVKAYKLVCAFLLTIFQYFGDESGFLEFKFCVLDEVIAHLSLGENLISIQIRAEILLAKRDCWIQGVLACTDYVLMGKNFPTSASRYTFGLLTDTFSNEEVFHKNYLRYTREILSLYTRCEGKRQRTADILSIEIGFLHYQNKEYENAVSLFLSCYEFYMQSDWDPIGIQLLKVFVDSLANCPHMTELIIDDEPVPVSIILSNAFLNILRISTDDIERKKWWKEFLNIRQDKPTSLVYSMEGLFRIDFDDHAYLAEPNVLGIDVSIRNHEFPEEFKAEAITFLLKDCNDCFVEFRQQDVILGKDVIKHSLRATEIIYGEFKPVSLEINMGNTTFVEQFLDDTCTDIRIEPLYSPDSVSFDVKHALELNLGEYALQLSCVNANLLAFSEVEMVVEKHDLTSTFPISFAKDEDSSKKIITGVDQISTVPYYLKEPVSLFVLRVQFSFIKNGSKVKFSETRRFQIGCYLPLSVSVEDIFKKDLFIFKFLLNSSTLEEPVILHSTRLVSPPHERHYYISGNYDPDSSVCLSADPGENCLNCYQITTPETFEPSDTFQLQITYNTLKEQLDGLVTDAVLVQGDVDWYSKFEVWKLVWEIYVLPLLYYDYDFFKEKLIIVLVKDSLKLQTLSNLFKKMAIENEVSRSMIQCLSRLIQGVQLSEIDVNAYTKNLTFRKLMVPVELPKFEQFFYVEFTIKDVCKNEVGVPIPFKIGIESLNSKWGREGLVGSFVFEIASSNDWLVHGKKRMLILADSTEITLHIIPLKRGYLNYPKVEIINIDNGEPSRIDQANCFDSVLVF